MKFISSILLMALVSFAACLYLPWWSIAVVAFVVSIAIQLKPYLAFIAAFVALFIFWGALAMYMSSSNNHLLAHKISQLVLKKDDPFMLIALTALIGGLVAGLSALSGSLLRSILDKTKAA
ncbi:MAG: hypothetical protein QM802_21955 [Agriterribacter sp.]